MASSQVDSEPRKEFHDTRIASSNLTRETRRAEHISGKFSDNSPLNTAYQVKPGPKWSVDAAELWKEAQRKRGFRSRSAPEGPKWYMDLISERNHVFVIDDSDSMRNADWSTLATRVSLLSYIIKITDPDNLGLYFSSSVDPIHFKKSTDLTEAVRERISRPVGRDNLVRILETVLQTFLASMSESGRNKGFLKNIKSSKRGRPMTCYILTDGAWFAEHGPGVESVIKEFVDELPGKVAPETDFGIQFISFGDHQEGLDFLEHLERDLHLGRGIVDTEPANGDVWKMLLGSINTTVDSVNQATPLIDFDRRSPIRTSVYTSDESAIALKSTMGNKVLDTPESGGPSFPHTSRINMRKSSSYVAPNIDEREQSNLINPQTSETVASSSMDSSRIRSARSSPVLSEPAGHFLISESTQLAAEQDCQEPLLPNVNRQEASSPDISEQQQFEQSSQDALVENIPGEMPSASDTVGIESMWSLDSVPFTLDQRDYIISDFSNMLNLKIQKDSFSPLLPKISDNNCRDLVEKQVKSYAESILQSPKSSEFTLARDASKVIHSLAHQITENIGIFVLSVVDCEELDRSPDRPEGEGQRFWEDSGAGKFKATKSHAMDIQGAKNLVGKSQKGEKEVAINDIERDLKGDIGADQLPHLQATLDREELCENLTSHPAFQVLTDRVINILKHHENDFMQVIEQRITAHVSLESMNLPRMILRADWDPLEFIEDQYGLTQNVDLGHILTITGDCLDAQMMTTSEYLAQTWPLRDESESWGPHSLLSTVQDAISQEIHGQTSRKIFTYYEHMTTVEVTCDRGQTVVIATGPDEVLLDVSQQLAWLGSACRAPPAHHGLSYCDTIWSDGPSTNDQNEASFHIAYSIVPLCENEGDRCWRHLIGNSVIAAGFPIAKRSEEMIGLQIPLQMMAALGGVSNVSGNDSGIVLKGPYVAFIPVKRNQTKDQIQWHLLQDGDALISYKDVLSQPRLRLYEFDGDSLSSTTAFLGWTPQVMNCAATGRIEYDQIARSEENQPSEWSVHFTGFQFGLSKIASTSATFTLGKKDFRKDSWTPSNLYGPLCEEASKQSVILYDTKAKRGWLTDAERVVFQIILHGLEKRKFSYVSESARSKIRPANECDTHSVRSRMNEYCEVELFQTRDISKREMVKFCFADLVKELLDAMSFLISESQRCTKELSGDLVRFVKRLGPQEILAYEYMDVLERSTKKMPRTVHLEDSCGKWPTFARDIQALILAGQDFQEVLQPHPSASKCLSFASLPTAKSYLAVELSTLRMLSKTEDGQGRLGPSGLHWDASKGLFDRCPSEDGQECQCKRIQGFSKSTQRMLLDQSHSNGAVIFGEESNRRFSKGPWNRAFLGSHTTKRDGLALHSNGDAATVSQNENASGITRPTTTNRSDSDVAPTARETSRHPTNSSLSINGYSNFEQIQPVLSPIQPVSTVPLNTSTPNSSRRPEAVYHRERR